MRNLPWLAFLLGCFALGCASDESVVCERLAECHLLPEGLTEEKCESEAVRQVSGDRLSKCADCVEKESCGKLSDACRKDCGPGD